MMLIILLSLRLFLCTIQDQQSSSLIGAGDWKAWLYFFRGVPIVHVVNFPAVSTSISLRLLHLFGLSMYPKKILRVHHDNYGLRRYCFLAWAEGRFPHFALFAIKFFYCLQILLRLLLIFDCTSTRWRIIIC